ncbi:MAG: SRPBCC family protein [Actinomycetota bacterium]
MELTNEFTVGLPVDEAWGVLTDVERIAPCMPGAQLQEIDGDEYRGVVKVKVGPITAQYKGKASFLEQDESAHRAVLKAEGRETRGQGNASATITATLNDDGDGTRVQVVTDLTVTGRVAQFGRGVLADVSAKLLGQFVECLESTVLAANGSGAGEATVGDTAEDPTGGAIPATEPVEPAVTTATAAPPTSAAPNPATFGTKPYVPSSNGPRKINQPAAEPVNLLDTAGAPVAKRLAPVGIVLVLLLLMRRRRRRRRDRRR